MSLWTKIFNRRPNGTVRNNHAAAQVNRFRPLVAELEDRSVPSAPVNDNFADAIELTGVFATTMGTNVEATPESGEPNHAGSSGPDNSVWWKWTAPVSGQVEINTFPSDFDTTLAVYTGSSVSTLSLVQENDDFNGNRSRVEFTAQEGTTYFIAVDGYNGLDPFTGEVTSATGKVGVNLGMSPANDDFANATLLSGTSIAASGHNLLATAEAGEPNHAGGDSASTVWWSWTPSADGTVVINTFGSNLDTVLGVYTGSSIDSLSLIAQNDDSGGLQSQVSFNALAGVTYQIAVGGFSIATGAIDLNLLQDAPTSPPPPPPNTAPVVADQSFAVDENSGEGTVVGTVEATDADAGQSLSYSILEVGSPFVIDPATGAISVAAGASLDFETTATYQLTVQVTDSGSPALSSAATVTIDLNNVNEAPVNTVPGPQTADQNVALTINGISVADPDGDSLTVTLSVSQGTLAVTPVLGGASVSGNGTPEIVLTGSAEEINAVLAGGVSYVGIAGSDTLSVVSFDGHLSTASSVAITVLSSQDQAAALISAVNDLLASGSVTSGEANSLITKLDLKGNCGDASRIQSFIAKVNDYVITGVLTPSEAAPLLEAANNLLAGL